MCPDYWTHDFVRSQILAGAGAGSAWRNACLPSPRFQRFAARFPLTRPIARRRARGAVRSRRGLHLFADARRMHRDRAARRARRRRRSIRAAIAARIELPLDGAERLLRAAAALGLVERIGDDLDARQRRRGAARQSRHRRNGRASPPALCRSRRSGRAAAARRRRRRAVAASGAMPRRPGTGDAGGGRGLFGADGGVAADGRGAGDRRLSASAAIAACSTSAAARARFWRRSGARVPALELGLFDLPAVGERARARFESAGLGAARRSTAADFLRDPLPRGLRHRLAGARAPRS